MSATTKISFEQFQALQEAADETVRYELDEGELRVAPSPTPRHNIISYRLCHSLTTFAGAHDLGVVVIETDFRLPNAVRKPDVAFVAKERCGQMDMDQTPVDVPPTLAVEVVSPSNSAVDIRKKLRQYLAAGAAVWLVYPDLQLVELHDQDGVREFTGPEPLIEEKLFGGIKFTLSLTELFKP